jgi:Zn-dependent protease
MSEQHTQGISGGWLPPTAPDPPAQRPAPFGEPRRPWWRRAGSGLLATLILIGAKLKTLLLLLPKLKVLTTSGSMIVSVGAYALIWGWRFAIGFVVLLFIHEMGHVIALRREGVEASAPVFIPFLGAVVWAKSLGGNALAEARVGLAGPILGTIGAAACLPIAAATGSDLWRALAFTGFFLNLFNLLPVTPLDGGRAMAALAPWMWFAGLAAIVVLALAFPNPIILIIAVVGAFDVYGRWSRRRRGGDEARAYYAVRARGGHGRHPPAALDPLLTRRSPPNPREPGGRAWRARRATPATGGGRRWPRTCGRPRRRRRRRGTWRARPGWRGARWRRRR